MSNPDLHVASNPLLEAHREFLFMLAEANLDRRLRSKYDADDVVQETLIVAYGKFHSVREPNNPVIVKHWLKSILTHFLCDLHRRFMTDKRDINLERSIAEDVDRSEAGIEHILASGDTSPSMAAARSEELARLARALRLLSSEQREVVVQFHINKLPLSKIAGMMERSAESVTGLLRRGLKALGEHMR